MKRRFYQVYEYFPEENDRPKRLIYTFESESSAHDMVEFIRQNETFKSSIGVEEHEVTT